MKYSRELIRAIDQKDIYSLRTILSGDADPDAVDIAGRTPLMYAALSRYSDAVDVLLDCGASVRIRDNHGNTALHCAAQGGDATVIRKILDGGALVDAEDEHGNTPLSRAVFYSNGDGFAIQELLRCGADRNHKNKYGKSPLELAASISNYSLLQFFQ